MTEPQPYQGYITAFDIVKNTGTVFSSADGKEYPFSAADMVGKIPELQDYPGVFFTLSDGRATTVSYNSEAPRPKEKARKGLAILGAAKCPNCTWRIPILPSRGMGKVRNGEGFSCPECSSTIRLKSTFQGVHNYLAWGIIVIPAVARYILGRVTMGVDDQTAMMIGVGSLFFYLIQILAFFYLYIQEKLVLVKEVQVFD